MSRSPNSLPASLIKNQMFRLIASGICLAIFTVLSYSAVWNNGFVHFDDPGYVTKNPQVLGGLNWQGWTYAWTTRDTGNWIPLTWLSLQLDATLYGINPVGYHATSLILHFVNGLLIFIAFGRMTARWISSALAAALFLVHPMHVESVAWISERKDVLSTFWLLLTIIAYDRYARAPNLLRYLFVACMFLAGLLSKSMLVTTPVLLLLLDIWPLRRFRHTENSDAPVAPVSFRWLLLEKIPLILLSLVDGLITIQSQVSVETVADNSGQTALTRLASVCDSYGWYLQKTFWPTNLIPYYQQPDHGLSHVWIVVCVVVVLMISVFTVVWRRRTAFAFGWWWFVISLLPVIGLIRVGAQSYADRYAYIPHIGLFVGSVWACWDWAYRSIWICRVAILGVFTILVCLSLQTYRQVPRWRSNDALWNYTLSVDPNNSMAHIQLGNDAREAGRFESAKSHYNAALMRWPESFQIQNYLSAVAAAEGDVAQAELHSRKALKFNPTSEAASLNLSLLLMHQKRFAEAQIILTSLLAVDPTCVKARQLVGTLFEQQGEFKDAWEQFNLVLKSHPNDPVALTHGAYVLATLNRPREAEQLYSRLLKAQPDNIHVLVNSAILAEHVGDRELAKLRYRSVLTLQPEHPHAAARLRDLTLP